MPRKKNMNVSVNEQAPEAPAPEAQADQAAPKAENAKAESKPICLIENCGRPSASRGLCSKCLTAARMAVPRARPPGPNSNRWIWRFRPR